MLSCRVIFFSCGWEMRCIALVAVLGLVACGDDEDCHDEVRANGKTYCVPGPDADKGMCVLNPELTGLGADCKRLEEACPGPERMLVIYSTKGKVMGTCECAVTGSEGCDGSTWDL